MLIKLLSDMDKKLLIELAQLLALADKPLLWGGKTADELTSDTDLSTLSIQEGEQECELIAELIAAFKQSIDSSYEAPLSGWGLGHVSSDPVYKFADVKSRLIHELNTFPIPEAEKPETRVHAAAYVQKRLLNGRKFELPSAPKVILFELILVALRDGNISSIEWALLKEFQLHHQLEDFIFDDLLERAETLNQELSKTISIILE